MPTGQLIFLAILGAIFVVFATYVLFIRPRRRRRAPPPSREERRRVEPLEPIEEAPPERERMRSPDRRSAAAEPDQEEVSEREIPEPAEPDVDSIDEARRKIAEADRARREEAESRREEAESRRRRAEEDRRLRQQEAADRRRQEAERRRKAEEEQRTRREAAESRRKAEEERLRAEEEAKRKAEEEAARKKQEEIDRRRDRLRRLREGLGKTRDEGFVGRIGALFGNRELDEELIGDLEEIMLTADIGPRTADDLFQRVREGLRKKELGDPAAIFQFLKGEARRILALDKSPPAVDSVKPYVIMVVGVNGSGKTTTIGKLAAKYRAADKAVMLAAGDTFRAAASEQLGIWADRVGALMVRGKEGADPSSVIFSAIKEAQEKNCDVVIADTAGRLQTKIPLMEELKKIRRVIGKAAEGSPHEVLLVLDATNGQNAISQAKLFNEALELSGFVLTKLDGTPKGGVILGICDELKIPVRYLGIGESVDDLREFEPEDFVEALFEIRDEAA